MEKLEIQLESILVNKEGICVNFATPPPYRHTQVHTPVRTYTYHKCMHTQTRIARTLLEKNEREITAKYRKMNLNGS